MTRLKLLTLPPSPYNTKVRLALELKGLDFEPVLVDREDRSSVVECSGQPLTPVLIDGDRVVYDSFGILRYLDANWPEPRLFDPTPEGQREIQAWERYSFELAAAIGPVARQAFTGKIDDRATSEARARFDDLPQRVEDALDGRDYLMGDRPNAADLSVVPFYRYLVLDGPELPEGPARFMAERLDLAPRFSRTRAWTERVLATDTVGLA